MPSRNVVKEYVEDGYYHVYNRGVEKRLIFLDDNDYATFIGLLKRYLTGQGAKKDNRHKTLVLGDEVKLLAYCLMPNHFHLMLHQSTKDGVSKLMRRVMTGYAMYFNDKYKRVGHLFQGPYKASHINADDYLQHVSRYIHLNPEDYSSWPYSSFPYYCGFKRATWLDTGTILDLFENSRGAYLEFVSDYQESQKELEILKYQLATDELF